MMTISSPSRANLRRCLILSVVAASLCQSRADVSLPPLISDHMVLQKGSDIRIWGKADPEEELGHEL